MKKITLIAVLALTIALPSMASADTTCAIATSTVVSSTNTDVVIGEGSQKAVEAYQSPIWTAIPGATWIWRTQFIENPNAIEQVTFSDEFVVSGTVSSSTLSIAADDYFTVSVNGNLIVSDSNDGNFLAPKIFDLTANIHEGTNTISVMGTNAAFFFPGLGTSENNPGAVIYSLVTTSNVCTENTPKPVDTGSHGGGGGSGYINPAPYFTPAPATTPAPVKTATVKPIGGVAVANAAVTDVEPIITLTDATTTATTTEETPVVNLAAVATGFSGFGVSWKCILLALAIIIVIYIAGELLVSANSTFKIRFTFYSIATLVAIVILFILKDTCSIIPLIVLDLILSALAYYELV